VKRSLVDLCCCALLLSCSDDRQEPISDSKIFVDGNLADVAADQPTIDTLPTPDASAPITVTATLRFLDTAQPVADVDVCVYKAGNKSADCTKSSATGEFTIDVPSNADSGLVFEKAGTQKFLVPLHLTMPTNKWSLAVVSDAQATTEYAKVGVTYPPVGKGHLVVTAGETTIAVVPAAGVGPYYGYTGPPGIDKSLTQAPVDGWGEIMNLQPGTYDVDVAHATKTCTDEVGRPPSAGHTLRAPVLEGYVTLCRVNCQ
jgi:hypothetical protein